MAKFEFRLESLMRLRLQRRDQCRRLLAEILADCQAREAQQQALAAEAQSVLNEIREFSASGQVAVDRITGRRFQLSQLRVQSEQLRAQQHVLQEQLQLCRLALRDADQAVRLLERLRERQWEEFQLQQERIESREREDAWQGGQLARGSL